MAYTFLKAEGFTVGKSLVEKDQLQTASEIKQRCEQSGVQLLLPTDHQVVDSYEPVKGSEIVGKTLPIEFTNAGRGHGHRGRDGHALFERLERCEDYHLERPDGRVRRATIRQATIGIARAVAEDADRGAIVIVGGGDSVAAVTNAGVADRITHISTGGGATLECLAGEELPGVAALNEK